MNDEDTTSKWPLPTVTRRTALTATTGLLANSLNSTTATAQQDDREIWTFRTGGSINSSPTVVDGTVFVGSNDGSLYAVDAESGELQWVFKTGLGGSINSSPTVMDETIFVGSDDGNLYAVDVERGEQKWSFETGDKVRSSPTVVGGTVFVGSDDDYLYAVNTENGEKKWRYEANPWVRSSPTVADGTVFFGSGDTNLYAVDAESGDRQWSFKTGGEIDSSPAVVGNMVFIGSNDENLYAVESYSGTQRWRFHMNGGGVSSPAVVDGTAFVRGGDSNLYTVDAETGTRQWDYKKTNIYSSPTVVGGIVFIGGQADDMASQSGNLYAVDSKSGKMKWTFETGGPIYSSPTVVGETVFVGSDDGNLYAVDATDSDGLESSTNTTSSGGLESSTNTTSSGGLESSTNTTSGTVDSADSEAPYLLNPTLTVLGGSAVVGPVFAYGIHWLIKSRRDRTYQSKSSSDGEISSNNNNDSKLSPNPSEGSSKPENQRTDKDISDQTVVDDENTNHSADKTNAKIKNMIPETVTTSPRISLSYDDIEKGDRLGSGGNADVYRATAVSKSGEVPIAIKEPRMGGETVNTNSVNQVLKEAETWQQLDDHDHIVSVIDYGSTPLPWIGMEYMDGGDLRERAGELSFEQSLWTALTITKAVRYAHKRGIVHFDLKPSNILFQSMEDAWDVAKIADWGLSKHLLEHSQSVEGMSPRYAAPEQLDSDQFGQTDSITDIYQLGTLLYELFTGEPPFDGQTYEVMNKIQSTTPMPPSKRADLSEQIDHILLTALATERHDRYDDVIYLRDALQDLWDEQK